MTAVRLADGLYRFAGRLWAECRTRKGFRCARCDRPIVAGSRAYRPLTNDQYRRMRLHAACVERPPRNPEPPR